MVKDYLPTIDASLGLVYRLNSLWNRADYAALKAKYDEWNNILDALYRNLLYRENAIIEKDKAGKITSVKFVKKDTQVYKSLSIEIAMAKRKYNKAKNKNAKIMARSKWFHAVQNKDIWLRKFMQTLKLYLKENEKRPGSAMFGQFGSR